MNIRHYLTKYIAITAVVVLAATSCFGAVLSVPQYTQEKDQWCWDACCQMILKYYGHTYSQTEIAVWALGSDINEPNYLFDPPSSCTYHPCTEVLSHFGSIDSSGTQSYISWSTLDNEMANSRPVMIAVYWDSGGGHAIVLRGVDENDVYVNDPWYGQSVQSYQGVLRYRGNGTWGQTLQMTSSHADDNYTRALYYYNLFSQYYNYYQSTGNTLALAYAYYYYAYTYYYYTLYSNGSTYLANYYYDGYMAYAYYYYYAYYGYYSYGYSCYCYFTAYSYYYAYLYTGNYYYYELAIYYYYLS